MDSLIALLQDTPIPTILVVSGVVFLFLALAGQVAGKLEVPPTRQKWAAAAGVVFLAAGLLLYLAPSPAFGGAGLQRAPQGDVPSNSNQAAAAPQATEPPQPVAGADQPAQSDPASSAAKPAASSSTGLEGEAGCLEGFFSGIAPDRIVRVESGNVDRELLSAQQLIDEPAGLVLLEFGQPVVAIGYFFFEDDELFKISSLVDGACQPVDYTNASRGGDRSVLQNWDTLEVIIGANIYALRFNYYGGVVSVGTSKFPK